MDFPSHRREGHRNEKATRAFVFIDRMNRSTMAMLAGSPMRP